MSTWWMDCKNIKKKNFSRWLFEIIHIIRFEIWDLRSRDLKKFLGYDINYLSIWPFIGHPWFPTRKASKLIFVCFQLAGEWHHPACWKQSHGHQPVFWTLYFFTKADFAQNCLAQNVRFSYLICIFTNNFDIKALRISGIQYKVTKSYSNL